MKLCVFSHELILRFTRFFLLLKQSLPLLDLCQGEQTMYQSSSLQIRKYMKYSAVTTSTSTAPVVSSSSTSATQLSSAIVVASSSGGCSTDSCFTSWCTVVSVLGRVTKRKADII
ncbi:hypothetical protein P8452_67538 [Trifolium repens]|nr:hypothetical protein P8452_67538 [Trifolium repens]